MVTVVSDYAGRSPANPTYAPPLYLARVAGAFKAARALATSPALTAGAALPQLLRA